MILLWGVPGDGPLDAVSDALARRGAELHMLDQREGPNLRLDMSVQRAGWVTGGLTDVSGGSRSRVALTHVGAAYVRPHETGRVPGLRGLSPDDARLRRAAAVDLAMVTWADLTRAQVVNRPAAMAANTSKPGQLASIARAGFLVPDTIVTTDAAYVRAFRRLHGRVVYKSVSGVRSIVSSLNDDDLARLADVANGPTQFQEYVPGVDVRVHVVGGELIATEVMSEADDYRYADRQGASVAMAAADLPLALGARCRQMVRAMGLHVAGIDFRRTPDGQWYCLEVNPSPGFSFFELCTGQPIADSIAALLMRFDTARETRERKGLRGPRVGAAQA